MSCALTINPYDGSIHLDGCNLIIRNGLTVAEVKSPLEQFYRSELNHQNGYIWLMYHGFNFECQPSGLALCFHLEKLIAVHFGVSLPAANLEKGRPTRASINEEVAFLRKSLAKHLLRPFAGDSEEFEWGSAWAQFDAKGFSATAGIRYKN